MYQLSPKQKQSFLESNANVNIWQGAIRSGKTFSSLLKLMELAISDLPGDFIIVGRSQKTLKMNVIQELFKIAGNAHILHKPGNTELYIGHRKCHLIGASDESSEKTIRGATFAVAYVDEITLIPYNFWMILYGRMSVKGAQILGTTNPDSPFHWLKTDFLDKLNEKPIKTWHFTLDDNPSLDETFKINLKRIYSGLWYQRFIEGRWVLAEGTIYDFFDQSIHCIERRPCEPLFYVVGVDYGTTNPTAFSLIGFNNAYYPNCWLEQEYYYDSRKNQRQKTDSEYADDLIRFIEGKKIKAICIDPSAASFKAELLKRKVDNVMDADNDVLSGIRYTSKLLNDGTLKICSNCVNTIKEFGSYVWDEHSIKLGEDKPLKQSDHCFVGETLVTTERGQIPIKDINIGDRVLTPIGYKRVLVTHKHRADVEEYDVLGQKIICTPEHKFYTANRGWIEACNLIQSDMFLINISKDLCKTQLNLTENFISDIQNPKGYQIENITKIIRKADLQHIYIGTYGDSIMDQYPKETIFITPMETSPTMTLAISNVYQLLSIFPDMVRILQKSKDKLEEIIAKQSDLLLKNGISQTKGMNGINAMSKSRLARHMKEDTKKPVNTAKNNLKEKRQTKHFVRIVVSLHGEEMLALMMSVKTACFVVKNLEQINIQALNAVPYYVPEHSNSKTLNIKQESALSVKRNSELLEERKFIAPSRVSEYQIGKQIVYNLTVDELPVYYVNNILVHNCLDSLRYGIFSVIRSILDGGGEQSLEDYRKWKRQQGWL